MIIRILLLTGLAATGYFVFLRRNRLPVHIVLVMAMLAAGGLAVIFPEATNQLANMVGVGRGADLLSYLFMVIAMFVLIHYYTKFAELQRQLTTITRELAILRAEVDRTAPPADPPA